jgi:DNA-binding GntR family transcriptional regulator
MRREPAVHSTKKDAILLEIRRMIATGELERGSRLHQDKIAEQFHTSITPVREALRQLEAEGLLVSEPHRGVSVAEVDREAVKGIYIARRLLEPYAMQRAVLRASRQDVAKAEEHAAKMAAASEHGDFARARESNRAFHFLFYELSGPESLTRVIESLWSAFPWDLLYVLSWRLNASTAEHQEILNAVVTGDVVEAGQATARHIERGYLAIAAHLGEEGSPDPFDLQAT